MAVYFVIGSVLVAWALVLTIYGMARAREFPDRRTGRLLMGVSAVLAIGAFTALMATTEKERPREEAKLEAAEKAEARERLAPGGRQGGQEAGEKQAEGGIVAVAEDEYSIDLPSGKTLEAGIYAFDVVNKGEIDHDLQVSGPGVQEKTPLIDPGDSAKLEVQLDTGTYELICTVPGHEEQGMKTTLRVR
jgi:plastocyanin